MNKIFLWMRHDGKYESLVSRETAVQILYVLPRGKNAMKRLIKLLDDCKIGQCAYSGRLGYMKRIS